MSKYGIRFNSSPIEKSDAAVPQTILARMNELKMQGCEVITLDDVQTIKMDFNLSIEDKT
jgi:hypothetical protein